MLRVSAIRRRYVLLRLIVKKKRAAANVETPSTDENMLTNVL